MKKLAQEDIAKAVGKISWSSLLLTELQMLAFNPSSQAGLHSHPLSPPAHPPMRDFTVGFPYCHPQQLHCWCSFLSCSSLPSLTTSAWKQQAAPPPCHYFSAPFYQFYLFFILLRFSPLTFPTLLLFNSTHFKAQNLPNEHEQSRAPKLVALFWK